MQFERIIYGRSHTAACDKGDFAQRAQSAIRADGPPAAQVRKQEIEVYAVVAGRPLRAARANPVFGADEKRIRTKNTVIGKSKGSYWIFIQDRRVRVDMLFIRAQSAIPADGFRPREIAVLQQRRRPRLGIRRADHGCTVIAVDSNFWPSPGETSRRELRSARRCSLRQPPALLARKASFPLKRSRSTP